MNRCRPTSIMMTSSNGTTFRVTDPLAVTRSFDVFFDLRLNERLSKQSRGWWFETPSRSLWRHCNDVATWHPTMSQWTEVWHKAQNNPAKPFWIVNHFLVQHNSISLRYVWTCQVCVKLGRERRPKDPSRLVSVNFKMTELVRFKLILFVIIIITQVL